MDLLKKIGLGILGFIGTCMQMLFVIIILVIVFMLGWALSDVQGFCIVTQGGVIPHIQCYPPLT